MPTEKQIPLQIETTEPKPGINFELSPENISELLKQGFRNIRDNMLKTPKEELDKEDFVQKRRE